MRHLQSMVLVRIRSDRGKAACQWICRRGVAIITTDFMQGAASRELSSTCPSHGPRSQFPTPEARQQARCSPSHGPAPNSQDSRCQRLVHDRTRICFAGNGLDLEHDHLKAMISCTRAAEDFAYYSLIFIFRQGEHSPVPMYLKRG